MTVSRHNLTGSTMPPFYATDNLKCWFYVVFTETYERCESPEECELYFNILHSNGTAQLRDWAEENCDKQFGETFVRAVLNSVDFSELKQELLEWVEMTVCKKCFCYTDDGDCDLCLISDEDSGGE